ncbi:arginase family protein [Plantibacter sp. YIM 135249]|uniref:arginase family protein n=1 Tax=Plantibacter sp. YIM 135249 TaxID=3423918 RepID=UPI003D33B285
MIAIVSAPTNLGLRPPEPTSTPGTSKAPEALREAGLHAALLADGAIDAGVVLPGRYVDDANPGSGRIRNQDAVLDHAHRLADRIGAVLDAGHRPLVLGGDCSILLGTGLALARRGRHGLVHIDGHTDFRHPGNSDECASLAGEDLAAAIGLHWPAISDIDGMGPLFSGTDVVHVGARDDDEELVEVRRLLGDVVTASEVRAHGVVDTAHRARSVVDAAPDGSWLHLDIDVLDAAVFPAVDSPDPGGLQADELIELLRLLAPTAVGAQVTVFDPDLDPDGRYAMLLSRIIREGLGALGTARAPR